MSRYIVTELEGFDSLDVIPKASGWKQRGISVMVLDTAVNYRVMMTWRSEDYRRAGGVGSYEQVRLRAQTYCRALNEGRRPPARIGVYRRDSDGIAIVREHGD